MDSDLRDQLSSAVNGRVTFAGAHHPDDLHDESLHPHPAEPLCVARPRSTEEVAALVRLAAEHGLNVTPRGSGTGLSGGASPVEGGLVIAFDQMNQLLHLDEANLTAVVQPGITLRELDEKLAGTGLQYPVYPGEMSGSLGGNVNTNAGGMRAVRHGVTRHHVLGLEVVLMDATVLRIGGPVVKSSSGYDLTQLIIGSEGTLALVTEVTLKLSPRLPHAATLLAPFADVRAVTALVPDLLRGGLAPSILEYLDVLTMAGVTRAAELSLGIPDDLAATALAYLVIVLETRTAEQLELDLAAAAELVTAAGALDVYVLQPGVAAQLIEARERAFWTAKAAGAHEILDVVVPRASVPDFLEEAARLASAHGVFLSGCGHVGDGNVHMSVFQPDETARAAFLADLFADGVRRGGAVSGEHGLGVDKRGAYLTLADPALVDLQRRIKSVFDPEGRLNPYRHLDPRGL